MSAFEKLRYAAIESLDHTIRLRMIRRRQAMFNAMQMASLVERVSACRFTLALGGVAIGEFLAIVSQDFLDFKRCFGNQSVNEGLGISGGFVWYTPLG